MGRHQTKARTVCALASLATAASAAAVDLTANWRGSSGGSGGDNVHWSDPKNWDINIVPLDVGAVHFDVLIPATNLASANVFFDVPGTGAIRTFSLSNDSTLTLNPGCNLTVTESASIAGIISSVGGHFTATSNATFTGNRARVYAGNGGIVTIGATALASTGLWSGGAFGYVVNTWDLITATGTGSTVNLSTLQSINAGFADADDGNVHRITASAGGAIVLSGVQAITAPTNGDDHLEITVNGAASSINLSGVKTLTSAGGGTIRITASNAASLSLPAAQTFSAVTLHAAAGGTIAAAGTQTASYASTPLWFGGAFGYVVNTFDLMTASGPGAVLNLSSLHAIDAGFTDADDGNVHRIWASNGGSIDLSRVQTISAPVNGDDRIEIAVDGPASSINLAGLKSLASPGSGTVLIRTSNGASLALPSVQTFAETTFHVAGGATITAAGTQSASYSSVDLWSGGAFGYVVNTYDLMTAQGAGSILDLSSVEAIDAGFTDADDGNVQRISASGGALINLHRLQTITGPTNADDRIEFVLDGAASSINLSSLRTIASGSRGVIRFSASASAVLDLPALHVAAFPQFDLASGAVVNVTASSLASIADGRFAVSGGARFQTAPGTQTATYSSANLWFGGAFGYVVNTFDLMTATGPGSVLDLSSLREIDAGFADADDGNVHRIWASNGGSVNLSRVRTLTAPVNGDDRLEVTVYGASSSINLANLNVVNSAGGGMTQFQVTNGGSLSLPAVSSFSGVVFKAGGAGSIGAAGTQKASYSSTNLWSGGAFGYVVNTYDLMTATGPGSVLNLSAVHSIDAGFIDADDGNVHRVIASSAGLINLSGVRTVTAPGNGDDRLEFHADGGTIDLSSLAHVNTAAAGTVVFNLTNAATATLGAVDFDAATTITLGGGSILRTRDLRAFNSTTLSLHHPADTFDVAGSLRLRNTIALSATTGATLQVARDLLHSHTNEANLAAGAATLRMNGSGLQQLETAGIDVDVLTGILTNDNFSFGRMIVGRTNQSTIVELREDANNGNRASNNPEVLYLFGPRGRTGAPQPGDPDALAIQGGSTLLIYDRNVYARQGDTLVSLQPLFGTNQLIAYSGGYLSKSFSVVPGAWNATGPGNWEDVSKWLLVAPNAPGASAVFGNRITAAATINVNSTVTAGFIGFDNANAYTLSGTGAVNLTNADGLRAGIHVHGDAGNANHNIAVRLNLLADLDLVSYSAGVLTISGPLDNPAGRTIIKSGAGTISIAGFQNHGPGAVLRTEAGTLRLLTDAGSPASRTATLRAEGGTAELPVTQHVARVELAGGNILIPSGSQRVLVTSAFAFTNAGQLDLTDHPLVVDYSGTNSAIAAVRTAIRSGYNATAAAHWAGPGIVSSLAAALPSRAVAYAEASEVATVYVGEPVDPTAVVTRYTLFGDANLDGTVDFTDLVRLAQNYNTPVATLTDSWWYHGDFTFDGDTDFDDLVKLAQNYNTSLPPPSPSAYPALGEDLARAFATAVPEPGHVPLVLAAFTFATRPRKRRGRPAIPPPHTGPNGRADRQG